MSQQKFIDREEEMEILKNQYDMEGSGLIVIYGRRRVGKTELINNFMSGHGLYFLATNEGDTENIRNFQKLLSEFLNDKSIEYAYYNDWYSLFSSIVNNKNFIEKTKKSKIIIAIDEFPYLIGANRSIPSIFQKIYDSFLKNNNVFLILSGSSVSIMENDVLSYKSPLYGRRTGQIRIKPLKFKFINNFLKYNIEDLCNSYFVLGGIPEYILKFNTNLSFWNNLKNNFLNRGSYLYEEAEFLLRGELREARNYFTILKAIAIGNHRLNEICSYTGMDKSMVSKYIDVLISLDFIEPEIPFGSDKNFKRRLYWIKDNYLSFWFRYILPNKSEIENSRTERVFNYIKNDFNTYAGEKFEYLIRSLIYDGLTGKYYDNVSRWWGKNKLKNKGNDIEEIDIVAYSSERNELLFGECKWTNKKISASLIDKLMEKSKILLKNYNNCNVIYALFSKSGFIENKNTIKNKNIILMDLNDVKNFIEKNKS